MAVRINASGEYLRRITNLPLSTSFTMCGWAKITLRPSSYQYWGMENNLSNATEYSILGYNTSNTFQLSVAGAGVSFPSFPPDGTWIFWAITNRGTGANDCKGYWTTAGGTYVTISTIGKSWTPAHFTIGNNSYDEYMNGAFAFTKIYNVVLSEAELYREMYSKEPVKTAGINLWSPHYPGSIERAKDYSGHGRHFTEGGTLTDELGPIVKWETPPSPKIYPGAFVEQEQVANAAITLPRHRSSKPPTGAFELNEKSEQARGLIGWWPILGSKNSVILKDLSGHGHHGSIAGAGALILDNKGVRGPGIRGQDAISYFDIADTDKLDTLQTMAFWVYLGAMSTYEFSGLFQKDDFTYDDGGFSIRKWDTGAEDWAYFWNPPDVGVSTAPLNNWHHIVCNGFVDAGGPDIWINNIIERAGLGTGVSVDNAYNLRIGFHYRGEARQWSNLFWMSEIRGYDYKLSDIEISSLYNNPWELYKPIRPRVFPAAKLEETPVEAPVFEIPVKTKRPSAILLESAFSEHIYRSGFGNIPFGGNDKFSASMWVRLQADNDDWGWFFSLSDSGDSKQLVGVYSDGVTLMSYIQNGDSPVNGSVLTVGEWYHIGIVREGPTIFKTYLNGKLDITNTGNQENLNCNEIYFGRPGSTQNFEYWDGRISNIKMWTVAKSQTEIIQEMRAREPITPAYIWLPTNPGHLECSRDYSGHGRNFAEYSSGVSLKDYELGPIVKWDEIKPIFFGYSTEEEEPDYIWPFSDNFTGSDDDPWDTTKWTTSEG